MQHLILKAREERWHKRNSLIKEYNKPVVTITLNIPGEEKSNDNIEKAFLEICKNYNNILSDNNINVVHQEKRFSYDGPEAYIILDEEPKIIKKVAVEFEENHKLGRIADIDVMNKDGKNISRQEIGFESRRCYICDNIAHYCVVNKTHEKEEINKKIQTIIADYFEGV